MFFFTIPSLIILASQPGSGETMLIKFELYKGAQKNHMIAPLFSQKMWMMDSRR